MIHHRLCLFRPAHKITPVPSMREYGSLTFGAATERQRCPQVAGCTPFALEIPNAFRESERVATPCGTKGNKNAAKEIADEDRSTRNSRVEHTKLFLNRAPVRYPRNRHLRARIALVHGTGFGCGVTVPGGVLCRSVCAGTSAVCANATTWRPSDDTAHCNTAPPDCQEQRNIRTLSTGIRGDEAALRIRFLLENPPTGYPLYSSGFQRIPMISLYDSALRTFAR